MKKDRFHLGATLSLALGFTGASVGHDSHGCVLLAVAVWTTALQEAVDICRELIQFVFSFELGLGKFAHSDHEAFLYPSKFRDFNRMLCLVLSHGLEGVLNSRPTFLFRTHYQSPY